MPYIGEGRLFFGAEAPAGWVFEGSLLLQSTYPALYAVMGLNWGDAPEGYFYAGQADIFLRTCPDQELLAGIGGEDSHILSLAEMPEHAHQQRRSANNYAYSEAGTGAYGYTPQERDGDGTIILTEAVGGGQDFDMIPRFQYTNVIIFTGVGGTETPTIEESNALIANAIEYLAGILSYLLGNPG